MTPTLKYPEMRLDLVAYTGSLRDRDHQRKVWVLHQSGGRQDSFMDVVHFFFDDTKLAEEPATCVGVFLRDQPEADAVDAVVGALDEVLDQVGPGKADADYLAAPGWDRVVTAATSLAHLLDSGASSIA